ncbi:unnamed protein product, partial [Allacma fusca]
MVHQFQTSHYPSIALNIVTTNAGITTN